MPPLPRSVVVRVALLIGGHWTKKLKELNDDYLEMYRRWLLASLPPDSGFKLLMDGYDAREDEYPEEELISQYDVIMVSGSRKLVYLSPGVSH